MSQHLTGEILRVEVSNGTQQSVETIIHEKREFPEQWKIAANDCYRGVMNIFLGLSTAALTFPVIMLASRGGSRPGGTLLNGVNEICWVSWVLLAIAIFAGFAYFGASAQWVKCAWGEQPGILRWVSEEGLEKMLDSTFWTTLVCTVSGVVAGIVFALTST